MTSSGIPATGIRTPFEPHFASLEYTRVGYD
jgi:hypothetical protein